MKMYDAIVIGVGSMGSAICYHLARSGKHVLGLEQFSITHERGSHTGQSRLIRKAYFEHSDYIPLLEVAYQGWRELENEASEQVYWQTGIFYTGPSTNEIIKGVKKAANKHQILLQETHPPQFDVPADWERFMEPEAGFLLADRAIHLLAKRAQAHGAEIVTETKVTGLRMNGDGMVVETSKGAYHARKVVVAGGAYTQSLLQLPIPLVVTRQLLGWSSVVQKPAFDLGQFPCWMMAHEPVGLYYGFPQLNSLGMLPGGLKIAHHIKGEEMVHPADAEFDSTTEKAKLEGILSRFVPGAEASIDEMKMCRYTYTPDEHFIIDTLSKFQHRVVVATGFSGHGFKFAPVVGKIVSQIIGEGQTDLPIDFLRLTRFS